MHDALGQLPVRESTGRTPAGATHRRQPSVTDRCHPWVLALIGLLACAIHDAMAADEVTPVTPSAANPAPTPPEKTALKPGELTPGDQALVDQAIARLKRDLLLECLLPPREKTRLGLAKESATQQKDKTPPDNPAAAKPDEDKQLTLALEAAEKDLLKTKGRLPVDLTIQCGGMGSESLVGLALVKAGVSPNHPLLQQIWNDIQKTPSEAIYAMGVELMLVEAMRNSPVEGWPQITGKHKKEPEFEKVTRWVNRVAEDLMDSGSRGVWGYSLKERKYHDHSVTQYAVLGLKAARIAGWQAQSSADRRVWEAVLEHFPKAQEQVGPNVMLSVLTDAQGVGGVDYTSQGWKKSAGLDYGYESNGQARGWGYTNDNLPGSKQPAAGQSASYLNMTIAGLTAMILARSELDASPDPKSRKPDKSLADSAEAIRDGMAWVQSNWQADVIDGYGLYGIERLGVLGNLTTIGGHDWYRELAPKAAARIMAGKGLKGQWGGPTCDKAFYLLFLVRGTSSSYARPTAGKTAP